MCLPGFCNRCCGGRGNFYPFGDSGSAGFGFQQNNTPNAGFENQQYPGFGGQQNQYAGMREDTKNSFGSGQGRQQKESDNNTVTYTYDDEEPEEILHEPMEWNNWTSSTTRKQLQRHFERRGLSQQRAKFAADGMLESIAPKHLAIFRDSRSEHASHESPRTPRPWQDRRAHSVPDDSTSRERREGPTFKNSIWETIFQSLLRQGMSREMAEQEIRDIKGKKRERGQEQDSFSRTNKQFSGANSLPPQPKDREEYDLHVLMVELFMVQGFPRREADRMARSRLSPHNCPPLDRNNR